MEVSLIVTIHWQIWQQVSDEFYFKYNQSHKQYKSIFCSSYLFQKYNKK